MVVWQTLSKQAAAKSGPMLIPTPWQPAALPSPIGLWGEFYVKDNRLLERQAQDIGIGVVGECVTMGNDNDK